MIIDSVDGEVLDEPKCLLVIQRVFQYLSVHEIQCINLDELCQEANDFVYQGDFRFMSILSQSIQIIALLEEVGDIFDAELFVLAVIFKHGREPFEYFWIEMVLSKHMIDYTFAGHRTVDIFLVCLKQLDFTLRYLLEFLNSLELGFKGTRFLQAADNKPKVRLLNRIELILFFDDEGIK